VVVLVTFLILTPLTVTWAWPSWISAALLIMVLVLLLFVGQTTIFLLRLVAADRRSARRRPMSPTARKTVGDLEAENSWTGGITAGRRRIRLARRPLEAHAIRLQEPLRTSRPVLGAARRPARGCARCRSGAKGVHRRRRCALAPYASGERLHVTNPGLGLDTQPEIWQA
jgi:hypothetical protein